MPLAKPVGYSAARKQWDSEAYREKAKKQLQEDEDEEAADNDQDNPAALKKKRRLERDPLHKGLITQRSHLKGRQFQLDMTRRLGKTQVLTHNTPLNQQAGYYCAVCDCILKDSQSYLDHINGKWHNRALGMSMRAERAGLDSVRNKLSELKRKREDGQSGDPLAYGPDGMDRAALERAEAQEREKDERKERRAREKQRKREGKTGLEQGEGEGVDEELAAEMGFASFGGGKK